MKVVAQLSGSDEKCVQQLLVHWVLLAGVPEHCADEVYGMLDEGGAGRTLLKVVVVLGLLGKVLLRLGEVLLRIGETLLRLGGVLLRIAEILLRPGRSEERRVGKECRL